MLLAVNKHLGLESSLLGSTIIACLVNLQFPVCCTYNSCYITFSVFLPTNSYRYENQRNVPHVNPGLANQDTEYE